MSADRIRETLYHDNDGLEIEDPSPQDLHAWRRFVHEQCLQSISIPYAFTIGAVNIFGILDLREPTADSSTNGFVLGVLSGKYSLNREKLGVTLYDPLKEISKLRIELSLDRRYVRARLAGRRWDGKWVWSKWYYHNF